MHLFKQDMGFCSWVRFWKQVPNIRKGPGPGPHLLGWAHEALGAHVCHGPSDYFLILLIVGKGTNCEFDRCVLISESLAKKLRNGDSSPRISCQQFFVPSGGVYCCYPHAFLAVCLHHMMLIFVSDIIGVSRSSLANMPWSISVIYSNITYGHIKKRHRV